MQINSILTKLQSIGILSALLVQYEKHPTKAQFVSFSSYINYCHLIRRQGRDHPFFGTLQCVAEHAKILSPALRRTIKRATHSDKALRQLQPLVLKDFGIESMLKTTQAIDVIQGGIKANALPERAWAVLNHRISVTR